MILLDTNVLSELMRPDPNDDVVAWIDALPDDDVWISAITVGEIHLGLALLPEGRRRQTLHKLAEEMFQAEFFKNACLSTVKPLKCMHGSFRHEVVKGGPLRLKMHKLRQSP